MKIYKVKDKYRGTVRSIRASSPQAAVQVVHKDSGIDLLHLIIIGELLDDGSSSAHSSSSHSDSYSSPGFSDSGSLSGSSYDDGSSSDSSSSSSFDSGGGGFGGGD